DAAGVLRTADAGRDDARVLRVRSCATGDDRHPAAAAVVVGSGFSRTIIREPNSGYAFFPTCRRRRGRSRLRRDRWTRRGAVVDAHRDGVGAPPLGSLADGPYPRGRLRPRPEV